MIRYRAGAPVRPAKVLATFFLLALAALFTVSPLVAYAYIPCPGSTTYSGTVLDQEGNGIHNGYVYIYIWTQYPYQAGATHAWSNILNGKWTATLSNTCPAHATFTWVGDTGASGGTAGPVVLSVNPINQQSTYTLHVWEQTVTANVFYEYPDVANSQVVVSGTTGGSFTLGVQAQVSGGIDTLFLTTKVSGQVGTDFSLSSTYSFTAQHSYPYEVFWDLGTAIKVVDTSGNSIVYLRQAPITTLQSAGLGSDWQTQSGAIASGRYRWIEVAPGGSDTQGWGITTTTTVSAQVDVEFSAFGGTGYHLTTTFSAASSSSFSNTVILTNPSSTQNSCFLLYWEGSVWSGTTTQVFDLHVVSQKYVNIGSNC